MIVTHIEGIAVLTLENTNARHAFVDFDRDNEDGRRLVLEPSEKKQVTLKAGRVTITASPGVLIRRPA